MTSQVLLGVTSKDYSRPGLLTQERILAWFGIAGAYWVYEGEPSPEKPHAKLTPGLCSNGYFDVPRLLSYPTVTQILGREMAFRTLGHGAKVDWVVSSAYAAITLGHEVAKALGARFASVEKDPADPAQKRMLWRRLTIPAGRVILQAEELITTMGTTNEVRRAVEEGNAEKDLVFLSEIAALVHRPPNLAEAVHKNNVIALVEKEIWAVQPEECPLCKAGSPRFPPKTHWAELTGKR